jgi:hypothetical protein
MAKFHFVNLLMSCHFGSVIFTRRGGGWLRRVRLRSQILVPVSDRHSHHGSSRVMKPLGLIETPARNL